MGSILLEARDKFIGMLQPLNLMDSDVTITVKNLTPEEAIGQPGRRDFPIITGKERVIEAEFQNAKAQVFTDSPKEFTGKLKDVIDMPLQSNSERAIFIGVMNAVLKKINSEMTTLHCRDNDPELCSEEISACIKKRGAEKVGLIGLNPAMLESLSKAFDPSNVILTDLNVKNVNEERFGVKVWDGNTMTEKLVEQSDLVLLTGTTFVNGTFDGIWSFIKKYKKDYLIFGVTGAGICDLLNLNRICPYGKK